ncbi:SagB/ThcOx family dehydrogenase [Streptomyces sp. NPDC023327]|uniref:SagB/ThcOx family dehydrogenase n=1 Tax=Streptomyces sp. NPDC023327 TaxID=3157088 RepID=UPI0033C7E051
MKYSLNEFMRIRLEERPVCDLLLEGRTFRLPDARCLPVLTGIEEPVDRDWLVARFARELSRDTDDAAEFVDRLVETRILRPADSEHPLMPEVRSWQQYGWTDALIFHCLTEGRPYSDVLGAQAPEPAGSVLARRIAEQEVPPFWKHLPVPYQPLPPAVDYPDRDLADVLLSRRSHVAWSEQQLTADQVSRVLRDVNAPLVEMRRVAEQDYRTSPDVLMRNTYGDLETYVVVYDVVGLEPGIYHYAPDRHALGLVEAGDFRDRVRTAFVGQKSAGSGSCSLLISAVWERHMFRYANDPRAYRTVMTIMGQFAQRYLVAWTAFGFTTFPTPAHHPELTDALLGTDRFEESGIYLITAG